MNDIVLDLLPANYRNYKIKKIEGDASNREYFRLCKNNHSLICMNSSKEPSEFINFLNVHKILSKTKVSIPEIFFTDKLQYFIILEDFYSYINLFLLIQCIISAPL